MIDRSILPSTDLFDDVEPFDVDLGLTLRALGRTIFFEPESVVTYSAPPPLRVCDVSAYKFHWNPEGWRNRNEAFMRKWGFVLRKFGFQAR
ncbi:MAG TPA: hypothetical protein VKZ59_09100 [Acidobacteriota bacterium]|nr:hypothetical protein [Acidobacteriota bacterium]